MSKKLNAAQITRKMKQEFGSMNNAFNKLETNDKIINLGIGVGVGIAIGKMVRLVNRRTSKRRNTK